MARRAVLSWASYSQLPYERVLGHLEVERLIGPPSRVGTDSLEVDLNGHPLRLLDRLTYFSNARLKTGEEISPLQSLLEQSVSKGNRQATRYSAHGFHEYRGKFNPQMVRAIGNLVGIAEGSWVLDPFCGSGTGLLEAAHAGWNAVGIDMNPLAVYISNAKVTALRASHSILKSSVSELTEALTPFTHLDFTVPWSPQKCASVAGRGWREVLPNREYLETWFAPAVLAQMTTILRQIDLSPRSLRPIFRVFLSDLARQSSFQDPADLRIRRRKDVLENFPLIPRFLALAEQRIVTVLATKRLLPKIVSWQRALLGDARDQVLTPREAHKAPAPIHYSAAITSPPYATALPYIDSQRLSLALLDLCDVASLRALEHDVIGARDIRVGARAELETLIGSELGHEAMPAGIASLLQTMMKTVSTSDGFRRRNVPAVVARYFLDMRQVFENVRRVLGKGSPFALVVGANQTTLGGQVFSINTPELLVELAEANGWACEETIGLDTYQRFDLHHRNSIRRELLLVLRKA